MTGIIVHDWVERTGGSKKVLHAMSKTYQDAKILALWNDSNEKWVSDKLTDTWMAKTSLRHKKALALPFMLSTWRNQHLHDAEWALVSSHLFAHHVSFRDADEPPEKYVYVHTPARYIWEPEVDLRGAGAFVQLASKALRPIDRKRASEATSLAANSEFVRERIRRTWDKDATVIHPPVDVKKLQRAEGDKAGLTDTDEALLAKLPDTFVLAASRFVPYKRLEMAINVANAAGVPAVVAGSGPDETRLRARAKEASVPVHFVLSPSDKLLATLYQRCIAYVFAAVEDFGIMPVEAMAVGTPVICGNKGGVLETVKDGVSGVHLASEDSIELRRALDSASTLDREAIRQHALNFDTALFETRLAKWTGKKPVKL